MTDDEIEQAAAEVLDVHGFDGTEPTDPLFIAREERIRLLPGRYDGCFDGRIEYRRTGDAGQFYLFYGEEVPPFRTAGRVRFSIAHELGHYYLPPHRDYLLSGQWHSSHSDASPAAARGREREANRFAAFLLMPAEAFRDQVRDQPGGFCTLKDVRRLAGGVFQTSVTSTAVRYVELNCEACCLIVADKGKVLWTSSSDDLARGGFGRPGRGQAAPAQSVTAKALAGSKLTPEKPLVDGPVHSSVWLDGRRGASMWEEVLLLSADGRTLTLLTPQERETDYD